jgi:dolichyl-phosphate-mannose--protein O-mannosyl transferase
MPWLALGQALERNPQRFWLGFVLLSASAVTHFMWLSYPPQVVFDEVHFGKFVTAYCCTGEHIFDIHPPHGKLLIAGGAYLAGFRGGHSFSHIGQPYGDISSLAARLVPAFSGTMLPLMIFILLGQLGAREAAAFFGGMAILFDNALTVQTRIIALDGLLLLATFASLSLCLAALQRSGVHRSRLLAAAGALAGLAAGVKFTGLVAIGMILALLAVWFWQKYRLAQLRGFLQAGALVIISALLVYGAGWALHFVLLTEPGPGDAWGVPHWDQPVVLSFLRETAQLHRVMLNANVGLTASHPDSSQWWEWPFMRTSVFYWNYGGTDGRQGSIYFLGNPLVWWGSTMLLLCLLVDMAVRRLFSLQALKRAEMPLVWIPLLGYIAALAPLVRVPRALFLYHYLTPLVFAILAVVLWLDATQFFIGTTVGKQSRVYFFLLAVLIVLFLIFSPLTYGFLLSPRLYDALFWLPTWR